MRRFALATSAAGALLACALVTACQGPRASRSTPAPTAAPRVLVLVLGGADPAYDAAVARGARAEADRRHVALRVDTPGDGPVGEVAAVNRALREQAAAIIVRPTSYLWVLPVLRAAHDQQVPTLVLDQDPAPVYNPSYVWSFLSTAPQKVVEAAADRVAAFVRRAGTTVAVVAQEGDAGRRSTGSARARLAQLRIPARLTVVPAGGADRDRALLSALTAGGTGAVLALDPLSSTATCRALTALRRSTPVVAVDLTGGPTPTQVAACTRAVLRADAARLGRLAVDEAIAAAAGRPDLVRPREALPPLLARH